MERLKKEFNEALGAGFSRELRCYLAFDYDISTRKDNQKRLQKEVRQLTEWQQELRTKIIEYIPEGKTRTIVFNKTIGVVERTSGGCMRILETQIEREVTK